MPPTKIEAQVYEGIRKTISRFRRRPYEFFTEAELHTSLRQDIVTGCADMALRIGPISLSLVHQEYPTNFRYKRAQLVFGYQNSPITTTSIDQKGFGDRGNFDLAVLSPDFVKRALSAKATYAEDFETGLRHVINKDVSLPRERLAADPASFARELMFALEVKYLHLFNDGHKQMLREVVKDCEKLRLAFQHSGRCLKPVNIVFCSSAKRHRGSREQPQQSVIGKIEELATKGRVLDFDRTTVLKVPEGVALVFVESYLDPAASVTSKKTPRPIVHSGPGSVPWMTELGKAVL